MITFTGGTKTLELQPGSSIIGNVVAMITAETLALGGSGSASSTFLDRSATSIEASVFSRKPAPARGRRPAAPLRPPGDQRRHAGGLGG